MKRMIFWFLVFGLLVIGFQQFGYTEIYCKIKGRVIDGDTGKGIPDVNVNLHLFRHDSPREYFVLTDSKGYFTFSNIRAGRYCLNYFPLYPYASLPLKRKNLYSYDRAFQLNEGEIKNVIQPLEKGGEIILNFYSPIANIAEQYVRNNGYIHITVNDELFEANLVTRFINPRYTRSKEGYKITGLPVGQYLVCRSYEKLPEFYSENNFEFAGVIKTFTLEKLEQKKVNVEYNSTSRIIIKLEGQDNMTFNEGSMGIYKIMTINEKQIYYNVWYKSLEPTSIIHPIIIEPGRYIILIRFGNLKNADGTVINFGWNEYLFHIGENETKEMTCLILLEGREVSTPGIYIH